MSRRLAAGGAWLDRSRPVTFTFDGREVGGFAGDTVASALLGAGVIGGFRSPLAARPRGVMTAGVEEPNAFVEIAEPWFEPILPATTVAVVDGMRTVSRAGVGVLPREAVTARPAATTHCHVDVLVIGAGAAGRAAAAGASGRVLLVDEHHVVDGAPDGVTTLAGTTATGIYDDGYVVLYQREPDLDRIWHVRAREVVLAAGAHERPIAFAGNDLPSVMLAGAAREYLDRYGVLVGERVVVFTTNHAGTDVGIALADVGAHVTIVDAGDGGPAAERALEAGLEVHLGAVVTRAQGDGRIEAVTIRTADGDTRTLEADLIAVSGGFNPTAQLARSIGAGLVYIEDRACFVPDGTGPSWLRVVGAAAGEVPTSHPMWVVAEGDDAEKYVEPQRDQTVADVTAAVGMGLSSSEHVKRATSIGTTIDQGRTSGVITAEIVNALLGWSPGTQGPTTARPPYTPVPFSALAGLETGPLLTDPIRTTAMHAWHAAAGALFEPVGQWLRAWYYPRGDEPKDDAVARECATLRRACGLFDASTLGKIDVCGPDAGVFLDRMYTNRMSTLAPGSIRYGLMLGLDGMIFDDGVAMRLGEDRYLVTTTTGGAAEVLDRFEEWLQTEWTDLRVYCTSVTEQWAVATLGGPRARDVLAAAGTDIDLANDAFGFMTLREGTAAGVPARVCRVSFTGELSYEVHVDARLGLHVWEALMSAGQGFGITPYGTEAMHVLRAEKGYAIVGQDTDGTVTPEDLGMGWIVNTGKGDFIGKRSLVRSDTLRPGRKQLVGLLPDDPSLHLREGTQVVATADLPAPPVPMLGHVTSSYRSPALGRSFALAMLADGRALHGSTVHAVVGGATAPCRVAEPVFVDREGARRDG
ncbi:MAG: 2Fe-2S iron-sulfur cluster-binding protein [Actinomycetota bacterium]